MRSLSEIDTVSKRSSRAAGYSWGISEEIGKNIRLLEMFSLPGIKNLNDFYKKKKDLKLEELTLIKEKNETSKSKFCPIIAGVSFLDQVGNLKDINEIKFTNIAYPILFLPFVSRASEVIGKRIHLKLDDKEFIMNFNNSISYNFFKSEIIELSEVISINILENKDTFSEIEWKELYKLSEDTFVEENDSLKQSGAGAGLTDND
ncbi:DUF3726 domain-containing protein [Candidatus Pelagibacter sp.]|jgi:hypothetical protein|nr:DUF3726 domain-containing protein [Candidatus Pelagibacter bacterium]MDB2341150.1 DUF3726 domain-containing protein [Candidatus Pelagibacter bacterium]MDC0448849.1 DUF3726 domain-containing protein [Candidatus Pelagibacter sp.]MDC0947460.1 DUF3726 domain-containing protein [Candidatus Pelagibacter sp.]MDC1082562.1 DUF3726 domain-containing protein [Candidatus Pelagibacter sp.]